MLLQRAKRLDAMLTEALVPPTREKDLQIVYYHGEFLNRTLIFHLNLKDVDWIGKLYKFIEGHTPSNMTPGRPYLVLGDQGGRISERTADMLIQPKAYVKVPVEPSDPEWY